MISSLQTKLKSSKIAPQRSQVIFENVLILYRNGVPALTTSANFNEVQNEEELTDEGVKSGSISSTLGGKRPAPSAAEGGSSEDEGAEGSASSVVPRRTFTRTSGAYAAAEEVTLACFS